MRLAQLLVHVVHCKVEATPIAGDAVPSLDTREPDHELEQSTFQPGSILTNNGKRVQSFLGAAALQRPRATIEGRPIKCGRKRSHGLREEVNSRSNSELPRREPPRPIAPHAGTLRLDQESCVPWPCRTEEPPFSSAGDEKGLSCAAASKYG